MQNSLVSASAVKLDFPQCPCWAYYAAFHSVWYGFSDRAIKTKFDSLPFHCVLHDVQLSFTEVSLMFLVFLDNNNNNTKANRFFSFLSNIPSKTQKRSAQHFKLGENFPYTQATINTNKDHNYTYINRVIRLLMQYLSHAVLCNIHTL